MPDQSSNKNASGLVLPITFPQDDYTPHGYLDNPHHSMVANQSGVIRSVPPLGFGYWCRTFRGCYGTGPRSHVNYLALLNFAVTIADTRLVTTTDFSTNDITITSHYHTKHLLTYDWSFTDLTFSFRWFLPRENTLGCHIALSNHGNSPTDIHLHAHHLLGLWETRWWGADGVGMHFVPPADAAVTTFSAYGDYFALGADVPSHAHKATADTATLHQWLRENNFDSQPQVSVRGPGPLYTVQSYALTAPPGASTSFLVCLARGVNEPAALAELATAKQVALPGLEELLDADEAFWSRCPQLAGDWPATWKRGWVYDWETLRMNVRPPAGIFKHPWDAMQIHSPRSVLGEASVDMLTMSLADPKLAQDVMLGTFADAPEPNVPCCREDGSMNMVAADGKACGTAPSWCFPFHVLRAIFAATGDIAWLKQLYPSAKVYLDWWLTHRTDEHGWLFCHCDWESGQDGSRRFPEAEGADADNVRTVDVESSMAEALQIMAHFADILGHSGDVMRWGELAERRVAATREMFRDGWFRDFDTRTNEPIILPDYVDVMMLAPLTCGVATPEQIAAIRPRFEYFRENPKHWLEWPSFFLAYTEAAWTAGLLELNAEATADIADRIYPRTDQRTPTFGDATDALDYRIPGVACEYWPLSADIEPGGECYGWGATLPLHIVRSIIGLRETADLDQTAFYLAPTLPERLLHRGHEYTIRNLHFRDLDFTVTLNVQDDRQLAIALSYTAASPTALTVDRRTAPTQSAGDSAPLATNQRTDRGKLTWTTPNATVHRVTAT